MKNLIIDLKQAEKILIESAGSNSVATEFHTELVESITRLENGDKSVISDLWIWFTPTFEWDDFGRDVNLGEKIYQQLNKLHP